MKRLLMILLTAAFLGGAVQVAIAAPHKKDPSCSVSPSEVSVGETYVVSAAGLPDGAINLWVTHPDGTVVGSPLGSTPDGTFAMNESSDSPGVWTYAFSGPERNNTKIYASCSVDAY